MEAGKPPLEIKIAAPSPVPLQPHEDERPHEDDLDAGEEDEWDLEFNISEPNASSSESESDEGERNRELRVDVLGVRELAVPEQRPGDFARSLLGGDAALLHAVYAEVQLGNSRAQTRCEKCPRNEYSVHFEGERLAFNYVGEKELVIRIYERRNINGALFGHPLVGETAVTLGANLAEGEPLPVEAPIRRTGVESMTGLVSLRLALGAPANHAPIGDASPSSPSADITPSHRHSTPLGLRVVSATNMEGRGDSYVKCYVISPDGDVVATARTILRPEALGAGAEVRWNEVLALPRRRNRTRTRGGSSQPAMIGPRLKKRASRLSLEVMPEDWAMSACTVQFHVFAKRVVVGPDRFIGQCVIALPELLERPRSRLMLFSASGNAMLGERKPHFPIFLEVGVEPTSIPRGWPQPVAEQRYRPEDYPRHVFMMTRGTRGDVQPFVALARGLADQLGWLVTLCTELRWKPLVKEHARTLRRGRIRFRPSGGDTELRVSTWIASKAIASQTELMQMIMLSQSEAEFFPSAPVFVQWVHEAEAEPRPIDLVIFSFTVSGLAALISEFCNKPIAGFVLQPSAIPSSSRSWDAVQHVPNGLPLVDAIEKAAFTSHSSLRMLKRLAENNPCARWNLDYIRGWFGLPAANTFALLKDLNTPMLIPMKPGTFSPPGDWWSNIELTDFIFLRSGDVGADSLEEPLASFVQQAKSDGAKLCLITFSSMPVPRSNMLRAAVKIILESRFDCRVIYVGARRGEVPAKLQAKFDAVTDAHKLLEVRNADFGILFREIDCFVVHGGLGTTVEALRTGRPTMVSGPLLLDQRFWGSVCAEKGVGPEPVHFDALEEVCVDYVNNALDPDDPCGWQRCAREANWGDISDDGVTTNVDWFSGLVEHLGRYELRVHVLEAKDLGSSAYRLGDLTRQLVRWQSGPLGSLYVVLRLSGRSHRTSSRSQGADSTVDFRAEAPVVFPCAGTEVLEVSVFDQRGIMEASFMEHPLLGSAELPLSEECCDGTFREVSLGLIRASLGSFSDVGVLRLRYGVVGKERGQSLATVVSTASWGVVRPDAGV